MAILTGQNIGANQRGILNLGSTINTPLSATLQAVTDGDGNASPLTLSTTSVAVGQSGLDGSLSIISTLGTTALNLGVRSGGFSNALISSNDINFVNNQTGYTFASGSTWISPLARLHVRGDGTNNVARFESSNGINFITINSNASQINIQDANTYIRRNSNTLEIAGRGANTNNNVSIVVANTINLTTGNATVLNVNAPSIQNSAGNSNIRPLNVEYTLNNSGAQTGTATGIFLNATETALNGMGHNLMDLQRTISGVTTSRFRVSGNGSLNIANIFNLDATSGYVELINSGAVRYGSRSVLKSLADSNFTLFNNAENAFGLLQLGGTTNAFPAIKRNGTAIDFRLADDSGFCAVNTGSINTGGGNLSTNAVISALMIMGNGSPRFYYANAANANLSVNGTNITVSTSAYNAGSSASAVLEVVSTTQGFLPPRMTTTQVNAIASPATGLVVYSTTENALCLYNGSSWRKLNDSPL